MTPSVDLGLYIYRQGQHEQRIASLEKTRDLILRIAGRLLIIAGVWSLGVLTVYYRDTWAGKLAAVLTPLIELIWS
jgi:hypothetical protein